MNFTLSRAGERVGYDTIRILVPLRLWGVGLRSGKVKWLLDKIVAEIEFVMVSDCWQSAERNGE